MRWHPLIRPTVLFAGFKKEKKATKETRSYMRSLNEIKVLIGKFRHQLYLGANEGSNFHLLHTDS